MTIEDRIRRVLADAVSDEPPPRGAPLEVATRPRRARPLLAGVVAMVLVLAAAVTLAAVRGQHQQAPLGPTPTTTHSTRGWRTYTDPTGYLRFRYPPDWVLHRQPQGDDAVVLVPPEDAGQPVEQAGFRLRILLGEVYWVGEMWQGTTSTGRLPGGQAYLLDVNAPTAGRGDGGFASYSIDWGRWCHRRGRSYCGPHSVLASFSASSSAWDRHRAVADAIVRTATRLRPTGPSVGDRSRPPCRPDQWKLIWPEEWAMGDGGQRFVHQGGVRFRKGPPCHLRLTLRLAVQDKTGRLLPVGGNPARTTVEGDLPEDGIPRYGGSWAISGAFMWRFAWQEWCNRGLPRATLKVTAPGAAALTVPGPRPSQFRPGAVPGPFGCRDRGRPSTVAGWP